MQKVRIIQPVILFTALLLSNGCTAPQPVRIDQQFWEDPEIKVGIVLTKGPEKGQILNECRYVYTPSGTANSFGEGAAEGAIGGAASFLLSQAFENKIYNHVKTIPATRFYNIKTFFKRELEKSGFQTVLYDSTLDFRDLPRIKKRKMSIGYDFSSVFDTLQCDVIILLSLKKYGVHAYDFNLKPPLGTTLVQGVMIDKNGGLLWDSGKKSGLIQESSTKKWNDPPDYKLVTSVVNYTLESSKLFLLYSFFGERLTDETQNEIISASQDLMSWQSPEEHEARLLDLKYLKNCTAVNALSADCKKPYRMCEDCSNWFGATRKIEYKGKRAKVAGSEDGKIIMVMESKVDLSGEDKNVKEAAYAVLFLFLENNIQIKEVVSISMDSFIQGYYFKLEQDGYSLLKQYTVK